MVLVVTILGCCAAGVTSLAMMTIKGGVTKKKKKAGAAGGRLAGCTLQRWPCIYGAAAVRPLPARLVRP